MLLGVTLIIVGGLSIICNTFDVILKQWAQVFFGDGFAGGSAVTIVVFRLALFSVWNSSLEASSYVDLIL